MKHMSTSNTENNTSPQIIFIKVYKQIMCIYILIMTLLILKHICCTRLFLYSQRLLLLLFLCLSKQSPIIEVTKQTPITHFNQRHVRPSLNFYIIIIANWLTKSLPCTFDVFSIFTTECSTRYLIHY